MDHRFTVELEMELATIQWSCPPGLSRPTTRSQVPARRLTHAHSLYVKKSERRSRAAPLHHRKLRQEENHEYRSRGALFSAVPSAALAHGCFNSRHAVYRRGHGRFSIAA